jgi:hypothetical protein
MKQPEKSSAAELPQLQRWFQAVITHPEGVETGAQSDEAQRLISLQPYGLEQIITRSRALTAAERLAIYANAYYSRLLECLGEVFPMLKRTLGDEGFDSLCFGYLQVYPSKSYTLNELGRHFKGYLQETRPAAEPLETDTADSTASASCEVALGDWPGFLIDLVRLEWAIYEVFDGPGTEGCPLLSAEKLAGVSPRQWASMKLKPVVCLQLLKTKFPVNDYFTALRRAKPGADVAIPGPAESFVALTRREFIVRRHPVSELQFNLLTALQQGRTVAEAIESSVSPEEKDLETLANQLQAWFAGWTRNGFFEAIYQ